MFFPNGIAFISSAYRGSSLFIEQDNAQIAQAMCLFAMKQGYTPYASHLLCTQFLNDQIPQQRDFGIHAGHVVMLRCDRVFIYEPHMAHSHGVQSDCQLAVRECVPTTLVAPSDLAPCLAEIQPSRLYQRIFGRQ